MSPCKRNLQPPEISCPLFELLVSIVNLCCHKISIFSFHEYFIIPILGYFLLIFPAHLCDSYHMYLALNVFIFVQNPQSKTKKESFQFSPRSTHSYFPLYKHRSWHQYQYFQCFNYFHSILNKMPVFLKYLLKPVCFQWLSMSAMLVGH